MDVKDCLLVLGGLVRVVRKEPAMSEFKVGDYVIYMHPAYTLVYLVQAVKGMEILVNEVWLDGYHFRHATPEEIAAGRRIDGVEN
ncbi:hypothetical protein BFR82_13770 [Acinetobacter pittii]|nr:hypothetical protein BFR82_13770 [Acinetobacter pittii]